MAVMLTLGRLRQNGESKASRGCIGLLKKSNRHTNQRENICLACCMGAPGEKWNVKQRWQEAKGGPKSEAGSEIAFIQNSSNMAVVAGPGRQAPRAGGERVGRSRERKAKWWRRAVRSTALETLLFQSEG